MPSPLAPADFEKLRSLDTPTVSNAIERFDVRLRNEGFVHATARCLFPELPPMLGYAVTGRIRSSSQPVSGGWYHDHIGWWTSFQSMPSPRVMVLEDVVNYFTPEDIAWAEEASHGTDTMIDPLTYQGHQDA